MRFDQSLTAFALESSGAGARAIGACHTLTLALPQESEAAELLSTLAEAGLPAPAGERFAVRLEAPPTLTITL